MFADSKHRLISCRAGKDYTLWLLYADGVTGTVHLGNLIAVGAFSLLRDKRIFRAARIDEHTGTVAWRPGVRLDSEILYEHIRVGWQRRAGFAVEDKTSDKSAF